MKFVLLFVIGTILITSIILSAVAINGMIDKRRNKKTRNNQTNYSIPIGVLIFFLIVIVYDKSIDKKIETKKEVKQKDANVEVIKLKHGYHFYAADQSKEIEPIIKALGENCKTDECKIRKYFDYVKKIPYKEGEINKDKNPLNVIVSGTGDCDEKSFLLSSMLINQKYKCLILYSDHHVFIGVNIPNIKNDKGMTYIEVNKEKYYYAETTDENGTLGAYNFKNKKDLITIYDPIKKEEIEIEKIKFDLNHKT